MWWCVWVHSSRPCISCLPWLSLFRLACACALLVWLPFLGAAGSSLSLLLLGVLLSLSFCWLPLWLGACGLARSFPFPPPLGVSWCFWSSQCSAGPSLRISGCICDGPVVIPLVWRVVVDWLLSSLRSLATKASALCGLCPLHHVVGVVHVFLAPSLRYSPSCDPVYLRTPLKLHAPASLACAAFSLLSCCLPGVCSLLPCWSPLVSFSPRPLFIGFVCPPCGPSSWLVLVASPSVCFWFVLLAGPVLWSVWFVWFRCVFAPAGFSVWVLLLVASPLVILDRYARIF